MRLPHITQRHVGRPTIHHETSERVPLQTSLRRRTCTVLQIRCDFTRFPVCSPLALSTCSKYTSSPGRTYCPTRRLPEGDQVPADLYSGTRESTLRHHAKSAGRGLAAEIRCKGRDDGRAYAAVDHADSRAAGRQTGCLRMSRCGRPVGRFRRGGPPFVWAWRPAGTTRPPVAAAPPGWGWGGQAATCPPCFCFYFAFPSPYFYLYPTIVNMVSHEITQVNPKIGRITLNT